MADTDRFDMTITVETKTTDGRGFNKNTVEYFDMSPASLVLLEKVMMGAFAELIKVAEAKAIPTVKK